MSCLHCSRILCHPLEWLKTHPLQRILSIRCFNASTCGFFIIAKAPSSHPFHMSSKAHTAGIVRYKILCCILPHPFSLPNLFVSPPRPDYRHASTSPTKIPSVWFYRMFTMISRNTSSFRVARQQSEGDFKQATLISPSLATIGKHSVHSC